MKLSEQVANLEQEVSNLRKLLDIADNEIVNWKLKWQDLDRAYSIRVKDLTIDIEIVKRIAFFTSLFCMALGFGIGMLIGLN